MQYCHAKVLYVMSSEIICQNTFSIQKTIKDIAHKAFWDLLKEEFEEDPPKYDRALTLLEEIKEVCYSLFVYCTFISPVI